MTASSTRGFSDANLAASRSASARSSAAASCTVQGFGEAGAVGAGATGAGAIGAGAGGAAAGGGAGVSFVRRSWNVSGSGFSAGIAGARSSASRSPGRRASSWRAASCFPTFSPRTNTTASTTSAPTTIEATCFPSSDSSNFSRPRTRGFGSRMACPILGVLPEVASFRTLHPVRRRDAEDGEPVREHLLQGPAEEEPPGRLPRVRTDDPLATLLPLRVVRVERRDGLLQPERDPVRLVGEGGPRDHVREGSDAADQILLLRRTEGARRLAVEGREGDPRLLRLLEDRREPGVAVLHVEHGVVERLALRELDVEVELRVGAAGEEDEARSVAPDLVHELAQRHHRAGALRHLHGLAAARQVHHLDEHDVEVVARGAERLERRLEPRDVAAVVGAEDVDEDVRARALVPVVGDVGAEVRGGPVRLLHGPVDLVPVLRRAEEEEVLRERDAFLRVPVRLADGLGPLLRLGRRQLADVDEPLLLERAQEPLHRARLVERLLRRPAVERDVDRAEVLADEAEDMRDRAIAEEREPLALGSVEPAVAVLLLQLRRDLPHVLAGIALRRHRHRAAVQLLVAKVDRARERLHLGAVVVHVVLADDVEPRPAEQALDAVTDDGVPAVSDVHRAGRVRRDVLDDDLLPLP